MGTSSGPMHLFVGGSLYNPPKLGIEQIPYNLEKNGILYLSLHDFSINFGV